MDPVHAHDEAPFGPDGAATHDDDVEEAHVDPGPELFEALLASSADAFYVVDPDGGVQFANPAAVALLGYDEESELLGRNSHATIHYKHPDGSHFPSEECMLLKPRTTGEVVRMELDWFVRRDGTMVPIAYSSSPLLMEAGRGAVVVFRQVDPEGGEAPDGIGRSHALELHHSRARILASADAARRRISRDLHDGAQQRLVHVLMTLRSAAGRVVGDGAGDTKALLSRASDEVQEAIRDLRDLVAGVHPAILSDRGLRAAVESLAARSAVDVEVDVAGDRWPIEIEGCAYFVISEAMANVAKHAPSAGEVLVRVGVEDGELRIEVRDDGDGGANPDAGSGLRGLEDRVSALGGRLAVADARRRPPLGTSLTASLPLGRRAVGPATGRGADGARRPPAD
ncbi:PAS domain-containing protein [Patulibacter sp. NPDC049589]|uniref:PAS domain-containing sensor histidine kinase n=1 Tax=Patulibacter sp. NPDC049589 TaxID=3154731 RepID=UPI00343ECB16